MKTISSNQLLNKISQQKTRIFRESWRFSKKIIQLPFFSTFWSFSKDSAVSCTLTLVYEKKLLRYVQPNDFPNTTQKFCRKLWKNIFESKQNSYGNNFRSTIERIWYDKLTRKKRPELEGPWRKNAQNVFWISVLRVTNIHFKHMKPALPSTSLGQKLAGTGQEVIMTLYRRNSVFWWTTTKKNIFQC